MQRSVLTLALGPLAALAAADVVGFYFALAWTQRGVVFVGLCGQYERYTYRYSPLLAYALIPNVTLHAAW